MKTNLIIFIILITSQFTMAKGTSWYYTQWILSSGVKVSDCSEIKGGYKEFVKKVEPQLRSTGMDQCIESNSQGLNTNALICTSPSSSGNMISGFWFDKKVTCEAKAKEMKTK